MNIVILFRALLILILLILPETALAMYQRVASIACPDGRFVIEARLAANIKFIHSFVRYRYRGIELTGINYEQYPYLRDYLYVDEYPKRIHELDARHRFNPTLYFPPMQFGADEVNRLAACLRENQSRLRQISGKTVRGLLYWVYPVSSSVMVDGIARLVHTNPRIVGLYNRSIHDDDRHLVLIEQRGRVLLIPKPSNPDSTQPGGEPVLWGQVHPPRRLWGKPRLSLRPVVINGKVFDSEMARNMRSYYGLSGHLLIDDYQIVP